MSGTLLTYALATSPDPLQASASGTVTLDASNDGTRLVDVTSLVVTLVPGSNAKDLLAPGTAGQIATVVPAGWNVTNEAGVFTFTPPGGSAEVGRSGLVFQFADVAINDQPGTATVTIDETASSPSDPSKLRIKKVPLAKFPQSFSVGELKAKPLEVAAGGSTTLSWSGTPAGYTLVYDVGGGLTSVPVGDTGPHRVVGVTRYPMVVFTLVVSVTVPGQDEPLVVERQASVSVSEPAPVVTSFVADVQSQKARFTWTSANADSCSLNAVPQLLNANGAIGPLAPDRVHYTLTAHASETGATSVPAVCDLELTAVASQPLQDAWRGGLAGGLLLLSPDGAYLYAVASWSSGYAPYVWAVDTTSLATVASWGLGLSGTFRGTFCVALSPDGTQLVFSPRFFGVPATMPTLLSAPGLEELNDSYYPIAPAFATYSPDGGTIYVPGQIDSSPAVLVLGSDLTDERSFGVPGAGPCAVSPDGSRLYVAGAEGTLAVCETATGAIVGQTSIGANAGAIALDPIRQRVYTTGYGTDFNTVSIVDTDTMETLASPGVGAQPVGIVVGPAGNEVYAANSGDVTISVVDATTLTAATAITLPGAPMGLAIEPGGLTMYVLLADASVCKLQVTGAS